MGVRQRFKYWFCRLRQRNRCLDGYTCKTSLHWIFQIKNGCKNCPYSARNNFEKDWWLDDIALENQLKICYAKDKIRELEEMVESLEFLQDLMVKSRKNIGRRRNKNVTRRKCEVEGKPGYFHTWEHFPDTIEAGPLVGGAPAGQFSRVYGIVEFEDGAVKRVDPAKIIFKDKESTKEGDFHRNCANCIYQYLPITLEPCLSCGQYRNNWKSESCEFERSK